jgi:membrane protein
VDARIALGLLKTTASEWVEDKAPRMSAALAYYTTLSLAPLLVVVIAITAKVLGSKGLTDQIAWQIQGLVGEPAAVAIQTVIESANEPEKGLIAMIIGGVTLLFGASAVFGELQDALNTMWRVKPKPGNSILQMIRMRFLSFTMVFGTGFLLLVSLLITTGLEAFGEMLDGMLPGLDLIVSTLNLIVSFGVITILFAMIFKVLPDAKIDWRHVWTGAVFTTAMFTLGKHLLTLYLSKSAVGSSYGAAGSIVVLLVWVFYCANILYFGAEFTQVYWKYCEGKNQPEPADGACCEGSGNTANSRKLLNLPRGSGA